MRIAGCTVGGLKAGLLSGAIGYCKGSANLLADRPGSRPPTSIPSLSRRRLGRGVRNEGMAAYPRPLTCFLSRRETGVWTFAIVEFQAPRRGIAIVAQGKGRFDRRPGSTVPKIYLPFSCFAPAYAGAKQEKGRVHYRIDTQGGASLCPGLLSFCPFGALEFGHFGLCEPGGLRAISRWLRPQDDTTGERRDGVRTPRGIITSATGFFLAITTPWSFHACTLLRNEICSSCCYQ